MEQYESAEMYLETILDLMQKQGNVRAVDVVNAMGLAKSSVSERMKTLKTQGMIKVDRDGFISLTKAGDTLARSVLERHTVLTGYLKRIGVSPETAEKDACKIEHVISEETFLQIKMLLNDEK